MQKRCKIDSLTSLIYKTVDDGEYPTRSTVQILESRFEKVMIPDEHIIVSRRYRLFARWGIFLFDGWPRHIDLQSVRNVIGIREVKVLCKIDILKRGNVPNIDRVKGMTGGIGCLRAVYPTVLHPNFCQS